MALTPDLWLDIGPTLDRKVAAWAENHNQITVAGMIERRIVEAALASAKGQPGMMYAEPFTYFHLG